jgi:hypothetical protein
MWGVVATSERTRGGVNDHPHAESAPLNGQTRRVVVLRAQNKGAPDDDAGERRGCLVHDRPSRLIGASATGRIGDNVVERAVTPTLPRTYGLCYSLVQ